MTAKPVTVRLIDKVEKGWGRKGEWTADLFCVRGYGATQAEAVQDLTISARIALENSTERGHLVLHEDGTQTVCVWQGDVVVQIHVRENRATGSTTASWKSTEEAAQDCLKTSAYGPGVVVAL